MQINDVLAETGGTQALARELGITEAQAAAGAAALAPALLGGFKKQAQAQPGGVEGLSGLLGQLGGAGLMDNVLSPEPTNVQQGDAVLGQVFGGKEVSRAVAQNASAQTGLDPAILKKMLPILAMLVTGYMAKRGGGAGAGAAGSLGGLIGGMLGGGRAGAAREGSRAGGLAGMLDMDGNGNPLDDILRMVGKRR